MSAPRVPVHTSRQPIRWGDMDALGHVNNTVYFRFMEEARIQWLTTLRGGASHGDGSGPVIVNASCTFLVPLVYPGDVEVRMFLADPGRSSVASRYEIDAGGRRAADGDAKMVWIDLASGRPVPLPDAVRAAAGGA
jgi:acyl-CoA thioester hydrolase